MLPLTMCRAGEVCFIKKISGRDEVRQHLAELGFVVGEKVTVVSELAGNLILQEPRGSEQRHGLPHHGLVHQNVRGRKEHEDTERRRYR